MGTKNETAKPAAATAESRSPNKKTTAAEPPSPPVANGDAITSKVAAKKKPAKKPAVTFSTEDIALRAYFIAEARHRDGIHGDAHSDWVEAERQLRAERRKKTATKTVRAKKR